MHVYHDQLEVRTSGKGLYEITDDVQSKIAAWELRNGTVTVFVQHTSCSIVIMENADPAARRDLEEFFERLVPEDADYFTHDAEGSDDMPSHIHLVHYVRECDFIFRIDKGVTAARTGMPEGSCGWSEHPAGCIS